MPLIIPVGYAQAVWRFTVAGDAESMYTTCGVELPAGGPDFEDVATDLRAAWAASFLITQSSICHLRDVTLYVGQDGGPPAIYQSSLVDLAGGAAADALPPNSAFMVRKRTDSAGRRGRGRFYIPGVPEEEVDAVGNLTPTQVTNLNNAAAAFLTAVEAGGLADGVQLVILHRSEGIGTEPPPTVIQALIGDAKIATQRRRLRP